MFTTGNQEIDDLLMRSKERSHRTISRGDYRCKWCKDGRMLVSTRGGPFVLANPNEAVIKAREDEKYEKEIEKERRQEMREQREREKREKEEYKPKRIGKQPVKRGNEITLNEYKTLKHEIKDKYKSKIENYKAKYKELKHRNSKPEEPVKKEAVEYEYSDSDDYRPKSMFGF